MWNEVQEELASTQLCRLQEGLSGQETQRRELGFAASPGWAGSPGVSLRGAKLSLAELWA